ncbi:hypothetical protein EUGRSUZ_A00324 [Eucalyptus grandis]|uniref:Uncharacterized protein n=1 Tax=Eucalyptus grandis TaxID=71139 RepID=A0ACC3LZR0_EUCGR|nr:hypothetical protein EUGRSUZ_A00324 [Eucalyptus grandis]
MSPVDRFYGAIASPGPRQKEAKMLFLGLDNAGKTTLLRMLKHEVDVVVYLVEACDRERFAESKRERDALLKLLLSKGKVNLMDQTVRPLKVFMCSVVCKMGYGEGFKWMLRYIKY